MNQAELASNLNTLNQTVVKLGTKITTVTNVSPDLEKAFNDLSTSVQAVNALIPDAPAPTS